MPQQPEITLDPRAFAGYQDPEELRRRAMAFAAEDATRPVGDIVPNGSWLDDFYTNGGNATESSNSASLTPGKVAASAALGIGIGGLASLPIAHYLLRDLASQRQQMINDMHNVLSPEEFSRIFPHDVNVESSASAMNSYSPTLPEPNIDMENVPMENVPMEKVPMENISWDSLLDQFNQQNLPMRYQGEQPDYPGRLWAYQNAYGPLDYVDGPFAYTAEDPNNPTTAEFNRRMSRISPMPKGRYAQFVNDPSLVEGEFDFPWQSQHSSAMLLPGENGGVNALAYSSVLPYQENADVPYNSTQQRMINEIVSPEMEQPSSLTGNAFRNGQYFFQPGEQETSIVDRMNQPVNRFASAANLPAVAANLSDTASPRPQRLSQMTLDDLLPTDQRLFDPAETQRSAERWQRLTEQAEQLRQRVEQMRARQLARRAGNASGQILSKAFPILGAIDLIRQIYDTSQMYNDMQQYRPES